MAATLRPAAPSAWTIRSRAHCWTVAAWPSSSRNRSAAPCSSAANRPGEAAAAPAASAWVCASAPDSRWDSIRRSLSSRSSQRCRIRVAVASADRARTVHSAIMSKRSTGHSRPSKPCCHSVRNDPCAVLPESRIRWYAQAAAPSPNQVISSGTNTRTVGRAPSLRPRAASSSGPGARASGPPYAVTRPPPAQTSRPDPRPTASASSRSAVLWEPARGWAASSRSSAASACGSRWVGPGTTDGRAGFCSRARPGASPNLRCVTTPTPHSRWPSRTTVAGGASGELVR